MKHEITTTTPEFEPSPPAEIERGQIEVSQSRAVAEVQSAVLMAKKFPRDEEKSFAKLMQSCRRKSLAEQAIYTYPRGGTKVQGPSIRLAEAAAQAWGNIDYGVVELERRGNESVMQAYAWDLESNTRKTQVFTVPHVRDTKSGSYRLTDARDIYEATANQGSRRVRACLLNIIPGDVVEAAEKACIKTLAEGGEPLIDRVRKMIAAFADFAVTPELIEARLGHNLESTSEAELVTLRGIYQSIRDGMSSRDDHFPPAAAEKGAANLKDKLKKAKAEPAPTDTVTLGEIFNSGS
jgi:hypothetical protein